MVVECGFVVNVMWGDGGWMDGGGDVVCLVLWL